MRRFIGQVREVAGRGGTWSARSLSVAGRSWPQGGRLRLLEIVLLALLAVQVARIVWAIVTPVGAYGDWRGAAAVIPPEPARAALFASFDPFFHTPSGAATGAPAAPLALTVYGIRLDANGGGSAIIAGPDGVQNSYGVGEEVSPGAVLKAVAIDHVVIARGGRDETVPLISAIDTAATPGAATAGTLAAPTQAGAVPVVPSVAVPASIVADVAFSPRSDGGQVTGIILSPRGPAFQEAGLQAGDVVTQVNGRPVTSAADLVALKNLLVPGTRLVLQVERGGAVVPVGLTLKSS